MGRIRIHVPVKTSVTTAWAGGRGKRGRPLGEVLPLVFGGRRSCLAQTKTCLGNCHLIYGNGRRGEGAARQCTPRPTSAANSTCEWFRLCWVVFALCEVDLQTSACLFFSILFSPLLVGLLPKEQGDGENSAKKAEEGSEALCRSKIRRFQGRGAVGLIGQEWVIQAAHRD
jgi:hypothetical protein